MEIVAASLDPSAIVEAVWMAEILMHPAGITRPHLGLQIT